MLWRLQSQYSPSCLVPSTENKLHTCHELCLMLGVMAVIMYIKTNLETFLSNIRNFKKSAVKFLVCINILHVILILFWLFRQVFHINSLHRWDNHYAQFPLRLPNNNKWHQVSPSRWEGHHQQGSCPIARPSLTHSNTNRWVYWNGT